MDAQFTLAYHWCLVSPFRCLDLALVLVQKTEYYVNGKLQCGCWLLYVRRGGPGARGES